MLKKLLATIIVVVTVGVVSSAGSARAQTLIPQRPPDTVNLSGPRVGATFLSSDTRETLRHDMDLEIGPVISQFGWQKEKRFLSGPDGFTGVTEFVFLLGGMDQGVMLPSFNWLVGARTAQGLEFAVGPNLTPAGVALAVAGGVTFRTGNLNIPLNFAMVPSKSGLRFSLLAGFNSRKR